MNETSEQAAIKKAILAYYLEGHVKSDPELYKQVMHPEFRFFLLDDDNKLTIADLAKYMSWYNPDNADPTQQWELEFYYVDVTDNLAGVKLRLEYQKARYIDYFNMMKLDGKWVIVHKISHPEYK